VEELVIRLLENVVRSAPVSPPPIGRKQRDVLHQVKLILSQRLGERITLRDIAREVELSPYHLCRLFRRATGITLHQYRQKLLLRWSLESVAKPHRPLVEIALDAGFSSHSHFTSAFRREFAYSPSGVRKAII
jgi:AraC family transcriptional regulator